MKYGLFFTLLTGLFFLLGIFLYKKSKDKVKTSIITSACAFVVILGLIVFDILPEVVEQNKWYVYITIIIGIVFLWIIDLFVPHHHHHHHDNDYETKEHNEHLIHIGTITILALMLHNLVEGIALYSLTLTDIKGGLLMCLGIGLHNIPLGFQIASYEKNTKSYILITLLVLSAFLGSLIVIFIGEINELILGVTTAFTLGMILHILLFELLGELINNIKHKETYYGIIIGIIVLIIINII